MVTVFDRMEILGVANYCVWRIFCYYGNSAQYDWINYVALEIRMNFFIAILLFFTLIGCTQIGASDFSSANENSDGELESEIKEKELKEETPKFSSMELKDSYPGYIIAQKTIICIDAESLHNAMIKTKELPYIIWHDIVLESRIIIFINEKAQTSTLVQYFNEKLVCILSAGEQVRHLIGGLEYEKVSKEY